MAQSATPQVVGTGGGSSMAISGYQVDYSIGEMSVQTAGTDPIVTEGFEQPETGDAALPVLGLTLRVSNIGGHAQLHFSTVQEIKNDHFIVERSDDGRHFDTVAVLKTKAPGGYSTSPLDYYYTDLSVLKAISYYRICQVDKNNAFAYSDIVSVNGEPQLSALLKVYPNPVSHLLQVSFPVPASVTDTKAADIRVFDGAGRLVLQQDVSGTKQASINVAHWASGIYILIYEVDGTRQQTKFIKK